jgi:hypothetical protein
MTSSDIATVYLGLTAALEAKQSAVPDAFPASLAECVSEAQNNKVSLVQLKHVWGFVRTFMHFGAFEGK